MLKPAHPENVGKRREEWWHLESASSGAVGTAFPPSQMEETPVTSWFDFLTVNDPYK